MPVDASNPVEVEVSSGEGPALAAGTPGTLFPNVQPTNSVDANTSNFDRLIQVQPKNSSRRSHPQAM